jgi:WD40 repeat protein
MTEQKRMSLVIHPLAAFTGHRDNIYTLAVSSDGNWAWSGGADRLLVRWDLITLADRGVALLQLESPIYSLQLIENHRLIVIGLYNGGILFYDMLAARVIRSVQVHTAPVFDIKYYPLKDWLIAASGDGSISIWQLPGYQSLLRLQISDRSIRRIALYPDNTQNYMAVAGSDGHIRLIQYEPMAVIADWQAHHLSVFSLIFSADGKALYSGSRDAHIKKWDLNLLLSTDPTIAFVLNDVVGHWFAVNDLILASDNRLLVSASMDKTIKFWNPENLQLLKVLDRQRYPISHTASINKIHWIGENRLLSAADDRSICLFEIQKN